MVDHVNLPTNDSASTDANPENKIKEAFLDLDHNSKTLLKLFCFLDGTAIPELMLMRAKSCQRVWDSTGEVEEVSLSQAGLSSDVISVVSAEDKVEKALNRLIASMLVSWKPGKLGRILHLESTTQSLLVQCITDPLKWRLQACLLVCHTFPMYKFVEPL